MTSLDMEGHAGLPQKKLMRWLLEYLLVTMPWDMFKIAHFMYAIWDGLMIM